LELGQVSQPDKVRAQAAAPAKAALGKANATDVANQKLAADAVRLASKPEGVLPVLELLESWDASTPERTFALLEKLAADKRLPPPRAVFVRTVLAQARARLAPAELKAPAATKLPATKLPTTKLPAAAAQRDAASAQDPSQDNAFSELGYVTRFRLVGPFDNEGKAGFDTATPVEEKKLEPADLSASFPGKERPVRWRELPERAVRRGYVPLGALLRPRQNVCALAETIVHSDIAQPLTLWAGAGGAIKVLWNGEEVLRDEAYRQASPDRTVAMVGAHAGANRVLAKVCVTGASWGFFLRIGDAKGGVPKNVRVDLDLAAQPAGTPASAQPASPPSLPEGHAKGVKLPKPPEAPLALLERAVTGELKGKVGASALATLARFLRMTGADDPAERRAKQLAARATELDPSLDHLELAAELAEERSEIMRFAGNAYAKHAKDPRAQMLQARVLASGPVPEDALPLLEAIPKTHASWQRAQLMRAAILSELELNAVALRVTQDAQAEVGDTASVLRQLASLYQSGGDPNAAIETHKQVLARRADDVGSRRVLVADALNRSATAEVHEHLEAFSEVAFGTTQTLLYAASVYDALGRDDLVLATYRAGIDLIPEAPELYTAYGRALQHADQPELAAEAFQAALTLKPQDAPTRELLE
jgi:tetratricopeptide (TPR) repeat protein